MTHNSTGRTLPIFTMAVCVFATCVTQTASGQTISVQQPIVQQFSANSVIMVPHGGQAHLGSLSYGQDFGQFYGPLRWGSRIFRQRGHLGMTSSVYIQDFAEMDRRILSQPPQAPPLPYEQSLRETQRMFPPQPGLFGAPPAAPYSTFYAPGQQIQPGPPRGYGVPSVPAGSPLLQRGAVATRVGNDYLAKAKKAAAAGNKTLAEIYFKLAADNGVFPVAAGNDVRSPVRDQSPIVIPELPEPTAPRRQSTMPDVPRTPLIAPPPAPRKSEAKFPAQDLLPE